MSFAIYGAGGFGRQLVAQHRDRIGLIVDDGLAGGELLGLPIIGPGELHPGVETLIAIADPATRRSVADRVRNPIGSLFAPTALVGLDVAMGEGAVLCEMTQIVGFCRIGRHFHANIYSYIGHDCTLGDFVTFAPRVSVNGNVRIGDGVYVGAGAIIRQGVTIGEGAFIAMGALVAKDVPPGARVVGSRIFRSVEDQPPAPRAGGLSR